MIKEWLIKGKHDNIPTPLMLKTISWKDPSHLIWARVKGNGLWWLKKIENINAK